MPRLYVPRHPTTQELQERYPQTAQEHEAILAMRARVSTLLGGSCAELLVIIGPCGMTAEEDILKREACQVAELTNDPASNIVGLFRAPKFKPRTDPEQWHGLITNKPDDAYRIARDISSVNANWAEEIGTDPRHLERDSDLLTLAWKGARNNEENDLILQLARHDPTLPIAIKNGLDGETTLARMEAEKIKRLRGHIGAEAVLLYRGGGNAKTPETWENRLPFDGIIDAAHGGEQAHDPHYKKTKEGQIAALDHLIGIAKQTGQVPIGVMVEASDAPSRTDPVLPFNEALERVQILAQLKRAAYDDRRGLVS